MTGPWVTGEHCWAAGRDLLLGACCAGCGSAGWSFCPRCRAGLVARPAYLTAPTPCPDGFPLTATSTPYDPVLRRVVSAHKERQALGLTRLLGERLALSLALLLDVAAAGPVERVLVVPVPSAGAAVRRRGFDATAALAQAAVRRLAGSRPVRARRLLRQRRGVRDQAGLDARARQRNLAGAFRLRPAPGPGGPVVVVDDVVTTGSSLTEAVRVLRDAGWPVLGAATVAATVRTGTRPEKQG